MFPLFSAASKEEFLMLSLFSVALGHFVNSPFCLPAYLCELREARKVTLKANVR